MKYIKTTCALIISICCSLMAYDLDIKALSPVKHLPPSRHEDIALVKDGKLQFAIVADQAREQGIMDANKRSIAMAVKVLSEAFQKCTGETPAVYSPADYGKVKERYIIALGDCELAKNEGINSAKLPPQGFQIKTFVKGVLIVGNDTTILEQPSSRGRGTLFGALDFAERFLGVRYFFPGEVGTYWPGIKDFKVKPANYTDAPYFLSRSGTYHLWTFTGNQENIDKFGALAGGLKKGDVSFGDYYRFASWEGMPTHNPAPEKLAKAYPDKISTIFFTNHKGKTYYNPKAHLGNLFDFTNLEFADLLVDTWKKYLAGDEKIGECPRKEFSYGLICNDKEVGFGNCDTYLSNPEIFGNKIIKELNLITDADKARPSNALMANVYGRFVKYLAEKVQQELPGKKLLFLAYYNSEYAPIDPRFNRWPSNVEIVLCNATAAPKRILDKKVRKDFIKQTREWTEVLGHPVNSLWLYDEYDNPYCKAVIGEFVGELPKALGKYLGRGNLFFDSGLQLPYYTSFYSAFRYMWNPNWDADAAIEEHFPLFYGKEAGKYLIRFHKLLKKDCYKAYLKQNSSVPSYPPKVIEEMEELLKKAEAAIPKDSIEMRRFKIFAMPWAVNFESQHIIHSYKKPVFNAVRLSDGEKIDIDGKDNEAVWKRALPLTFINPKGSHKKPQFAPEVKVAWNDDGIYFNMKAPGKPEASKSFWDNCGYEIFLMPKPCEQKYQLALDANCGTYFGLQRVLPLPGPTDSGMKIPGLEIKAQVGEDSWNCEVFLPFTAFEEDKPKIGDIWRFNMVRNKLTQPREVIATSLTLGNHHNYNMFGNLKFEK